MGSNREAQGFRRDRLSSAAPCETAGPAPARPPRSARRTSSIDVTWPDGRLGDMQLLGRARDILTAVSQTPPRVVAQDSFRARLQNDRTILAMVTDPARPTAAALVGARGGGHLRRIIDDAMPEECRNSTPLHLILDDISGTSLIAGWAWSQWTADWLTMPDAPDKEQLAAIMRSKQGVCIGFAPGSSALKVRPTPGVTGGAPAPDLRNSEDPDGWHDFQMADGASLRRARRIDVTLGDTVRIDAAFQDSASRPNGGRMVLHEYRLTATADPGSLCLTSIAAEPRVLPFPECPSATQNLRRLLDAPLMQLRERVLDQLRGTDGCTHLNDALRALTAVPALLDTLRRGLG